MRPLRMRWAHSPGSVTILEPALLRVATGWEKSRAMAAN